MANTKIDITLNDGYTGNFDNITYLSIASGVLVLLMVAIITAV